MAIMQKQKNVRRISGRIALLFVIMAVLSALFTGCGENALEGISDDDSYEANLEEARIALDHEQYQYAANLLEGMPRTAAVLEYLSNAYSGLAGLDTFNLLTTIDRLNDEGNDNGIDLIGQVLGDSNGNLTAAEVDEKLENFNRAIEAMEDIGNLNDDQTVQRGLLGMARATLTIADVIIADDPNQDQITLKEENLESEYDNGGADFSDVAGIDDALATLSEDIQSIDEAINAIDRTQDGTNDLRKDFSDFQGKLDGNCDNEVSLEELENYVENPSADATPC